MSDKLTPEQLDRYRKTLHGCIAIDLLDHIAAVERERDELAAALTATQRELELTREFMATHDATLPLVTVQRDMLAALVRDLVVIAPLSDPSDYRPLTWLGVARDVQQLGERARRALAALDAAEDGTPPN